MGSSVIKLIYRYLSEYVLLLRNREEVDKEKIRNIENIKDEINRFLS